jgi:hypothetical protein
MNLKVDIVSGLSVERRLIVCDDIGHTYGSDRGNTTALWPCR